MTNGRRKHGKHSAALPETQPAGARETEAKTVIMTNRELEEKFATKEELKQSVKFLIERMDHEKQLHSQEQRSVESNLTQKIEAIERNVNFRCDMDKQFEASDARFIKFMDEFRSEGDKQIQTMTKSLESTIKQQYEKNMYKTAFIVVAIGTSLYGVYLLVNTLMGGGG